LKKKRLDEVPNKKLRHVPVTTNCSSPITLTPGTTYAVIGHGFWSSNQTSDILTIHGA